MKAFFLSFCFVLSLVMANAQVAPKEGTSPSNSLSRQFNRLKYNANTYQENNKTYKVVNDASLDAFWKSVQDSLAAREQKLRQAGAATEQNLVKAQQEITDQQEQLEALKEQYAAKEKEVQQNVYDVANLSVLGIDMEKQTYVILSFIVIITLLILLGVILLQYKSSKSVADEKRKAYDDVQHEYDEHRKSAREKELKLKRELQTEMNRIEELNQQIASLKKQSHV